jgi:hypothetical protein
VKAYTLGPAGAVCTSSVRFCFPLAELVDTDDVETLLVDRLERDVVEVVLVVLVVDDEVVVVVVELVDMKAT